MKKKIVLGLAIFTSVFVLGGIYLIITIEKTTSTLNNLIELHRVEILREQLLMNARKIQAGLALRHTRSDEELDSLAENMVQLKQQANKCLECHHDEVIASELNGLKGQIDVYENGIKQVFDPRCQCEPHGQKRRIRPLWRVADWSALLHDMTSLTHARLEKRTQATLAKISDMKTLIFILIVSWTDRCHRHGHRLYTRIGKAAFRLAAGNEKIKGRRFGLSCSRVNR